MAQASSAHACSALAEDPKPFKARGGCPPLPCSHLGPRPMLSMHELSLPEPMLSLSMLILATCPEHAQECSEHCSARSERSERPERSEHFWTLGTLFGYNTVQSMSKVGLKFAPSQPKVRPKLASWCKAPRAGTRLSGGAAEALGELKSLPDVSPHPGTSSFP